MFLGFVRASGTINERLHTFSFLILSFRESDGNNFYSDDRIGIY